MRGGRRCVCTDSRGVDSSERECIPPVCLAASTSAVRVDASAAAKADVSSVWSCSEAVDDESNSKVRCDDNENAPSAPRSSWLIARPTEKASDCAVGNHPGDGGTAPVPVPVPRPAADPPIESATLTRRAGAGRNDDTDTDDVCDRVCMAVGLWRCVLVCWCCAGAVRRVMLHVPCTSVQSLRVERREAAGWAGWAAAAGPMDPSGPAAAAAGADEVDSSSTVHAGRSAGRHTVRREGAEHAVSITVCVAHSCPPCCSCRFSAFLCQSEAARHRVSAASSSSSCRDR